IYSTDTLLPPKPFERRYYIVKITVNLMPPHLTHFNSISDAIQQADCLFILAVRQVGISLSPDRKKIHFWNCYNLRLTGRQIKLLILFLIIKCHHYSLPRFVIRSLIDASNCWSDSWGSRTAA